MAEQNVANAIINFRFKNYDLRFKIYELEKITDGK